MQTLSILALVQKFPDDQTCREYLEELYWNGKPTCPYCKQNHKIYKLKDNKYYRCPFCKKNFTVTVGTVFHQTHIPLQKWFIVMYLFASHKKGISSYQVAKDIEITQPNAWYMLHRIRQAMRNSPHVKQALEGIIELDETYVGGKNKNRHYNKKVKGSQGRSTIDKSAVFGMVERGGNVITFPIKRLYKKGMQALIKAKVKRGSILATDEYNAYTGLNKHFEHGVVNHGAYQYVSDNFHTNTMEGFWSWLKRGIIGIYHQVSKTYLSRYCKEFEFRYNTRKYTEAGRFDTLLVQALSCTLPLKNLVQG